MAGRMGHSLYNSEVGDDECHERTEYPVQQQHDSGLGKSERFAATLPGSTSCYDEHHKRTVSDPPNVVPRRYQKRDAARKESQIAFRKSVLHTVAIKTEKLMDEHSSYHNAIAGEEATFRLKLSGIPHCFLTRYSDDKMTYVLTVYMQQSPDYMVEHYNIMMVNGNKYQIEGKMEDFNNIEELLGYYMANRISPSLPNIGKNYELKEYEERQKWVEKCAVGEHSSYHNAITEEEAMSRLRQSEHLHCYLTYFNEDSNIYCLAVYQEQMPNDVEENFAFIMVRDKYKVEGKNEEFDSVESLLHHYANRRFNPSLSGIGHNYTFQEYSEKLKSPQYNMMGEHSSYHSAITEEEALRRLQRSGWQHCYLTYFSKEKQRYMLAVYRKEHKDVMHFPIIIRDGIHKLEGKQEEFDSIDKLLEHYKTKRIDPSLANIGNNYTLEAYNSKKCVIS